LSALRRFADANGAVLIGKTRERHRDPEFVHDYLDELFGDRCFHPFTTLELLRASDLYFGFFSASVIEAIGAGVYAITSVFFPPEEVEPPLDSYRRWSEQLLWGKHGFWNQQGVSEVMHGTRRSSYAALERFAGASLADYRIDQNRRHAVLSEFVSHMGSSCARFTDALASTWS
jgi:hypothetical protein